MRKTQYTRYDGPRWSLVIYDDILGGHSNPALAPGKLSRKEAARFKYISAENKKHATSVRKYIESKKFSSTVRNVSCGEIHEGEKLILDREENA